MCIAIVYKGHTLGLLHSNRYMSILNGLGSRGGLSACHDVPPMVNDGEYRFANRDDFDTFKVKYHRDYKVVGIQ